MIVRAYDDLWKVEKRLYRVDDIEVPGSPLYSQIAFFFIGLALVAVILGIFGLNGYEFCLVKYIAMPVGFSMFMTKVKFDGKRPDRFVMAIIRFYMSPRLICRYEAIGKPRGYSYTGKIAKLTRESVKVEETGEEESHGISDAD